MKALQSLAKMTSLVLDSGDVQSAKTLPVDDVTTNPSILLNTLNNESSSLIETACKRAQAVIDIEPNATFLELASDWIHVEIGTQLSKVVDGYISTEVDPRFAFDTAYTVEVALRLRDMYIKMKVPPERILIKIAATWEGIRAVEKLEKQGVHCNVTLVFSPAQAIAASQAKAFLISPFVGRVSDWYAKHDPQANDKGVELVESIYTMLKSIRSSTIIMGASFRSIEQILALAGCDKLTISPSLLRDLQKLDTEVSRRLQPPPPSADASKPLALISEHDFRFVLNEDQMACDLLADGIRRFVKDQRALHSIIQKHRG